MPDRLRDCSARVTRPPRPPTTSSARSGSGAFLLAFVSVEARSFAYVVLAFVYILPADANR